MTIYDTTDKVKYEIPTPTGKQVKTICPACNENRTKKGDKSLSWNNEKKTGLCHHCNHAFRENFAVEKTYSTPEKIAEPTISDKVVEYFKTRKISENTLKELFVTTGNEWMPQDSKEVHCIRFNYYRNERLVNVKYRSATKGFKLHKDAELIFYNLNSILSETVAIIVEGEMDVCALHEAGIKNVISVPNGANAGKNNLTYIDNCFENIEHIETFIIATDNDGNGINLREQLAFRLGIERCLKVDFADCKDSNEVLIKHGADKLKQIFENTIPFPIDGVYTVADIEDELDLMYEEGLKPGYKIGDPDFDTRCTFEKGRLYTFVGIPGDGKSEFVDYCNVRLNVLHGLKFAYFSPENHPIKLHVSKLCEKVAGCKFGSNFMTPEIYGRAKSYVNDNFVFVNPKDDYSVETVFEKIRFAIMRYGIEGFVLDPYNKFDHEMNGENESTYAGKFLDKLTSFCIRNNVFCWLVCHPTKMKEDAAGNYLRPKMYNISGSAMFYNKTDFGISIYKNDVDKVVEIYVEKYKFKHLGSSGIIYYDYTWYNGRYSERAGKEGLSVVDDNDWTLAKPKVIEAEVKKEPLNPTYRNETQQPIPF